ncbi:MAG: 2-dehydropantoate 2-reductase, partial [Balneolaceae bacterium]|nr:2-dehydropantoate 2-reductase [Balneolaceae bacterium]
MEFKEIMVMGAGAVGGYFGARIAEHEQGRVTFIARGDHLRAIQDNGVQILSPDGDTLVRVRALDEPVKAPQPDLVLFTVKSYDTETAIPQLRPVV